MERSLDVAANPLFRVALIASLLPLLACARIETGAKQAGTPDGGSGNNTGADRGTTSASPDAGSAKDVAGPGPADAPLPDLISADVSYGNADAACATQSAMAEKLPLDLFVMMDSSGSMAAEISPQVTKWQAVKDALTAFFNDKQSAGLGIGLQYFPLIQPGVPAECEVNSACGNFGPCKHLNGCYGSGKTDPVDCQTDGDCKSGKKCYPLGVCQSGVAYCSVGVGGCARGDACLPYSGFCVTRDRCDVDSYAATAVPLVTLGTATAAASLVSSLNGHEPDGLTPTSSALSGAIRAAQAHGAATPGHKTAVVLVTDGFPTECNPVDINEVAQIARTGAGTAPGTPTFVIGVFLPEEQASATTNLNTLAAAGGTGTAVVISTNQNVTQVLQTALSQIRTTAVACEYKIPAATAGAIDFGKVNVQFTSSAGATPTTVGYVNGKAGCNATRGGWYYDADPAMGQVPKSIIMCDSTCTQLRAASAGRVDIVLGCQTITII